MASNESVDPTIPETAAEKRHKFFVSESVSGAVVVGVALFILFELSTISLFRLHPFSVLYTYAIVLPWLVGRWPSGVCLIIICVGSFIALPHFLAFSPEEACLVAGSAFQWAVRQREFAHVERLESQLIRAQNDPNGNILVTANRALDVANVQNDKDDVTHDRTSDTLLR